MTEEDKKWLSGLFNVCMGCGRSIPPKDIDPFKLLDWYLMNDAFVKRAYDCGRHDERTEMYEEFKRSEG